MQFSVHYPPFTKKTLIAVTNNERARLLEAMDREVEEFEIIETPDNATEDQDFDTAKEHRLTELYGNLSERMRHLMDHKGFEEAIICVPEANKTIFQDKMHPDVLKRIDDVVPKNLASMDLNNVVRILIDG